MQYAMEFMLCACLYVCRVWLWYRSGWWEMWCVLEWWQSYQTHVIDCGQDKSPHANKYVASYIQMISCEIVW